MLLRIETENFALLRSVSAELGSGLTVISGESGAGKTLLLDAVAFALGGRPHRSQISAGAQHCRVDLTLELDPQTAMAAGSPWRAGANVLRRKFNAKGRTSALLNEVKVNISDLAEFAADHIDITGQFEGQMLFERSAHLRLLDRFGGADVAAALAEYRSCFASLKDVQSRLEAQQQNADLRRQEIEILHFQLEELNQAAIRPGERSQLERELKMLEHAEQITSSAALAAASLSGQEEQAGAYDLAAQGLAKIQQIADLLGDDNDAGNDAAGLADRVALVLEELSSLATECTSLAGEVSTDPELQMQQQQRLDLVHRLERKYSCNADQLDERAATLSARLDILADDSQSPEALREAVARLTREATALADKLSKLRRATAKKLLSSARRYLERLGFNSVEFMVDVEPAGHLLESGSDIVEFLVSLNPGEPARPLQQVASGGESSRLLLAIKAALAESGGQRVLLLDEIEAGLGGMAAQHLAEVLVQLASQNQVVAITHLPVVAALGDRHLLAQKTVSGKTSSVLFSEVRGEQRKAELARMLGKEGGKEELALVSRLLKRESS